MIVEKFFEDKCEATEVGGGYSPFEFELNYESFVEAHRKAVDEWKSTSDEEKKQYGSNIKKFFASKGISQEEDTLQRAKNNSLVVKEISERLKATDQKRVDLGVKHTSQERTFSELIENIENIEMIRSVYRDIKITTRAGRNSGLNATEAKRIKNCLRQGRELFASGRSGPLMVKPLNFFYSLTAYAYAAIVLNSPIRYNLDALPGSHGLVNHRHSCMTQFGGDTPNGTLSELFFALPTHFHKQDSIEIVQDASESLFSYHKSRFSVSISTMMSLIPEIRDYYSLTTGNISRTYPITLELGRDIKNVTLHLYIGDGVDLPPERKIQESFDGFGIDVSHGKYLVRVRLADVHRIRACIYTDISGGFWYIENPFFPVVLPEFCTHFIIVNALSTIMRYAPDVWGEILLNEADSKMSLIIRKYLSAFEEKFNILMLRNLSLYNPFIV